MGLITKSLANQIWQSPNNGTQDAQRVPVASDPTVPYVNGIEHLTLAEIATYAKESAGIESATYLPVASVLVNLDAATPAIARYIRIASNVFVSGLITMDPTAALTTSVRLTVPFLSAFAAQADASGDFSDNLLDHGRIAAVPGTALVILEFLAVSVASTVYGYNFSYSIIPT